MDDTYKYDRLAIQWSKEMETGVEKIDKQHQTLVAMINRLQSAIDSKLELTGISLIFGQLASYTKYHFKAEELILEKMHDPHIVAHRQIHMKFVNILREYEKSFRSGDATVVPKLLSYLEVWLVDHIVKEDKVSLGGKTIAKDITEHVIDDRKVDDWEWIYSQAKKNKRI